MRYSFEDFYLSLMLKMRNIAIKKEKLMQTYPNAKINIGLNIIEKRTDGYHNIETVFYPIGLSDILIVAPSDIYSDYSFSISGLIVDGSPENNLIIKALNLLRTRYHIPPVDISLIKQIPLGAGLGGGSSDGAFMLKALNEQFSLGISVLDLEHMAARLGADCPVFIRNRPVFATGIGNVFSPIDLSLNKYFLVLVKPPIHVSTPEAYSMVTPKKPIVSLKELVYLPINDWKNNIVNDFEFSVFLKYPIIAQIKEALYQSGAIYASMSGSGSAVYGIFESKPVIPAFDNHYFVSTGKLV